MEGHSSVGAPGGAADSQTRACMGMFLLVGLLLGLLLVWVETPADAQESPACDQYGACEETPPDASSPSPSKSATPPPSSAPASSGSASTSAPADATSPVEGEEGAEAPPVEDPVVGLEGTAVEAEAASPVVEADATASSAWAPASSLASASAPASAPPVGPAPPDGADTDPEDETPTDVSAPPKETSSPQPSPDNWEGPKPKGRPVAGYPYEREPCEDRYCGMENVEGPVECAAYETASGKRVYGCADPALYEDKACYDLTFYTERGAPYSNLNTCEGERPYGPPEPPDGDFGYWKPPVERPPQDSIPYVEVLCENPRGGVDWLCGLDVPKRWNCGIYYGTVHGTVRGCEPTNRRGAGSGSVRVYDEAGRLLGTYRFGGELIEEECGRDDCGVRLDLPPHFECKRVSENLGPLWGDASSEAWIECEDRRRIEMLENGELFDPSRTCLYVFDEDGRFEYKVWCHFP